MTKLYGDPAFQQWTLDQLEEAVEACSEMGCGIDDVLSDGDGYAGESAIRSLCKHIRELESRVNSSPSEAVFNNKYEG